MLPRCHVTDQSFCPECLEPTDEISVEAFETLDEMVCPDCAGDRLDAFWAAAEEADIQHMEAV